MDRRTRRRQAHGRDKQEPSTGNSNGPLRNTNRIGGKCAIENGLGAEEFDFGKLLSTAPSALAGSVTQPGDTMGSASGAPMPPGFYFANQVNWGCSSTTPRPRVVTEIPLSLGRLPGKY